jgi:Protein of unknown function (DUF2971)
MDTYEAIPGMTPEQMKILKIFHRHSVDKTLQVLNFKQHFVHYTSAETALKIIQNEQVWMRKPLVMNDFMEIQYGLNCLNASIRKYEDEIAGAFNTMFDGFWDELIKKFDAWIPVMKKQTFIACLSEHDLKENLLGRLSMWRAYGGSSGVALVFKSGPFLRPSDALGAYTSPVAYSNQSEFHQSFKGFIDSVRDNADFIKSLDKDEVFDYVFETFRSALLCTKHPGFKEEREWRVIYSPQPTPSDHILTQTETIGGIPQIVAKVPLKDIPVGGLTGVEIPSFIERIIIGPTSYPTVVKEAFVKELTEAGMTDAENRVIISDIPLRT